MATFYGKLKDLAHSAETKPIEAITKRSWTDAVFLIRGHDKGVPAWHYILVPHKNLLDLKTHQKGSTIDCESFGSMIQYRNDRHEIVNLSGWGRDSSQVLKTWVAEHYDQMVDEYTEIEYTSDDIRLCTMQRLTPNQKLGVSYNYSSQFGFHFIKLSKSAHTSLAYRSGIRDYDRWISLNGVPIENNTIEQISQRFHSQRHLPVQLLVCSPTTYEYYQENQIKIHADLPTVQRLRPVFDISPMNEKTLSTSSCDETFYVVQMESNDTIAILPQSSVFQSPDMIHINEIYFVEFEGDYHRGQIKFKGSKTNVNNFTRTLTKNY